MIDLVVEILQSGGYEVRPSPLHVADHRFIFDVALEGPHGCSELVLVLDRQDARLEDVHRRLRALTVALDATGSIRPLTIVMIGPSATKKELRSLFALCRVICVLPNADNNMVQALLSPLFELDLPRAVERTRATADLLVEELGSLRDDLYVRPLLEAANHGSDAVESAFLALLDQIAMETTNSGDEP